MISTDTPGPPAGRPDDPPDDGRPRAWYVCVAGPVHTHALLVADAARRRTVCGLPVQAPVPQIPAIPQRCASCWQDCHVRADHVRHVNHAPTLLLAPPPPHEESHHRG